MKKDFNNWLSTMKDSIATWDYYVDFKKVYENIEDIEDALNLLNGLINKQDIEGKFKELVRNYPVVLKAIPILLAVREHEIKIKDGKESYNFEFIKMNYSIDQYVLFMRNSGLFDLLQNHIINNLKDYVTGIEVGLDSNARKNRGGHLMEDLVESYLIKAGLIKDKTYFKEIPLKEVEKRFKLDLSKLSNEGKTQKRFDFVFLGSVGEVYACECNFYTTNGSKLNETARSYKTLTLESKGIKNFNFVWFTDGVGWKEAKNNLEETYEVLDNLYNINDLENGIVDKLINLEDYISLNIKK